MNRLPKVLLTIVAAIVLLAVAGLIGLHGYLQSDAFRQRLQRQLSQALERPVSFEKTPQVSVGLPPHLTLRGLRVANPEWASGPYFLKLKTLELAPRLSSLLHLRLGLDVLGAQDGVIAYETGPDGQPNWPHPKSGGNSRVAIQGLAGATFENIQIVKPGAGGDIARLDRVTAKHSDTDGRLAVVIKGRLRGRPLQAELTVPDRNRIKESQKPLVLGIGKAQWGESDLSGKLSVERGAKPPKVTGTLQAQQWVVPDKTGKSGDSHDSESPLPKIRIPLVWRKQVDADIDLKVKHLRAKGVAAHDLNAHLTIDGTKLEIDPLRLQIEDGKVDTRLHIDAEKLPPTLQYAGRIDQLNLRHAIEPLLAGKGAQGYVNTQFDLSGRGADTQAILKHISGTLRLVLEQGRLSTALLNRLVLNLGNLLDRDDDDAEGGTPIRCMAVQAQADSGSVDLQKMIADTKRVLLIGDGNINLANGGIDVSLDPAPNTLNPLKTGIPIRISGTLAHPKGRIDAAATIFKAGSTVVQKLLGASGILTDLLGITQPGDSGCRATLRDYAS